MMKTILSATIVSIVSVTAIILTRPDPVQPVQQVITETREVEVVPKRMDIEEMIRWQAVIYGVDPDMAVMIAQCESGLDPYAQNPTSTAKGVYQFLDGTWEAIKAQGHQFDAEENIRQFMIWWPIHPDWWICE